MARALGVLVAVAAGSACYSPQLRDCTVSCATDDDCAGAQVCGADRMCAMPAVADHCSALTVVDAGAPSDAHHDAAITKDAAIDAAIPIDAPPLQQITLHVHITGKGSVFVDGHGNCAAQGPQHGDCLFTVVARVAESLHALAEPGQQFTAWTSPACQGQGATCVLTPTTAVTVSVAFDKTGGDDQP
jgi:hypothetical protein